jgi:hypothetical protein
MFSWESQGIVSMFLKVAPNSFICSTCAPCVPDGPRMPQGLQERPVAAVMEFKSYLLVGLVAWMLQMIVFAPAFYYVSRLAARQLLAAKERKMSV